MSTQERVFPINIYDLREWGVPQAQIDLWVREKAVHEAQQQMLRDFVSADPAAIGGMGRIKCLTPAQYQTDCGECVVCCASYKDGALKWYGKTKEQKREAMDLFREKSWEEEKRKRWPR